MFLKSFFYVRIYLININLFQIYQSAEAVEYTDCFSADKTPLKRLSLIWL